MQRLIERVKQLREVTGGSTRWGFMVDEVSMLLYALVKFHKPDLIIQTGHLWGKSALVCLEALTDGLQLEGQRQEADKVFEAFVDEHGPKQIQIPRFVSIDPYTEGLTYSVPHPIEGVSLLRDWYPNIFRFFKMKSSDFFLHQPSEVGWKVPDMDSFNDTKTIYGNLMTIIDGDHSPEGCRADLEASAKIGAKLIFLDDVDWISDIGQAGLMFSERHGYRYTPFHLYNGVAILSK